MSDAADPLVPAAPPAVEVRQAPPVPVPPVLVVETVPAGAALTIDGKEWGPSPHTFEALGIGSHQVVASLEGYQPASKTVSLANPGERVMVDLTLVPVPVAVVTPPVDPVKPPVTKAAAPPRKKAPVEAGGKLTLKTTPWTTVYLGKKKLGDTPLISVPLPPGKHTLRLVNPETNAETSIEVEIKSNETTVKKLML
jgi:hypothetical protein